MSKFLFRRQPTSSWTTALVIGIVGCLAIKIFWSQLYYPLHILLHNTMIHGQSFYHALPIIQPSYNDHQTLLALQHENNLLKEEIKQQSSPIVWKKNNVKAQQIKNILWKNNAYWYATDPCDSCIVFNHYGLVGRMDPLYGNGVIKLINHADVLLVSRSKSTGQIFLLQGQGFHNDMLILESDATDYPPMQDDILYTSGLDTLYPQGIPIGKVLKKSNRYLVQLFFNQYTTGDIYVIPYH